MATELAVQSERAYQKQPQYVLMILPVLEHSLTTVEYIHQREGECEELDKERKGRQEMVQGRRSGLQDAQERD